jgi:hypothetical protein
MHGSGDVLHRPLAEIGEGVGQPVADLLVDRGGDADRARLGQALQPGGEVDAVAQDVLAVDHHVAEMDADPQLQPLVRGAPGLVPGDGALDLDRGLDGVCHRPELHEGTIAHQLDDPAAMAGDDGLEQRSAHSPEPGDRPPLVPAHEARVAHHVRREHGGEPAIGANGGHAAALPVVGRRG